MIHLYTGDGKGKTTAAVGLLIRAAAAGKRCLFCQFLKDGESSERALLETISGIEVMRAENPRGFYPSLTGAWRTAVAASQRALLADALARAALFDVIVLDELVWLVSFEIEAAVSLAGKLSAAAENRELVLTGRNAPQPLIDLADYVTEMKKIKHPFDTGVSARRGIEY